jgi:hypothetical protein
LGGACRTRAELALARGRAIALIRQSGTRPENVRE